MRISDWSSDVCSSDLDVARVERHQHCLRRLEIDDARGAEQRRALGRIAEAAGRETALLRLDNLGPRLRPVDAGFLEIGIAWRADDPVDAAVHRARGIAFPRLALEIGRPAGRERVCQYV